MLKTSGLAFDNTGISYFCCLVTFDDAAVACMLHVRPLKRIHELYRFADYSQNIFRCDRINVRVGTDHGRWKKRGPCCYVPVTSRD